ncbi:MAG: hypothetical protein IAI50_01980, partial [Candidatus Eremiobacteraeota bacterium]|nr:hypothetical protein [Candidatus Eremiobacteraeota bacterium]
MTIAAVRTVLTFLLAIALVGASAPLEGRFALQSGDVKTQGHFRAVPFDRDPLAR